VCEKDALLSKFQRGIVQVYTRNGKEKPTAAFRQPLGAVGREYRRL